MNTKQEKLAAFSELLDIMDTLREKCPWDQKQTLASLRPLTLEVYELSDALMAGNYQEIKKELGDVMLHLVFYAKVASEGGYFDIADALRALNQKLIFRHPHIYGDTTVQDEEEVKRNWEKLKLKEGNTSVLAGVTTGTPSLIKAYRIQDKVSGIGFEFPDAAAAWAKVEEELQEFHYENDPDLKEEEFGDVLFSLVNYARLSGINADTALERSNRKFMTRFKSMESLAADKGTTLQQLSLEEMDALWEMAKKQAT